MNTSIPDSHRDLLEAPVATLATVGPDGRPQVSAVWFVAEDDTFKISLNTSRQKSKNLQQRPGCTMFVLDLANPYRYLEVRGDAVIEPDDDYEFADRVGAKYGGADLRNNDAPGEKRVVVTLDAVHVVAADLSA